MSEYTLRTKMSAMDSQYGSWKEVVLKDGATVKVSTGGWIITKTAGGKRDALPSRGSRRPDGSHRVHVGSACYLVHNIVGVAKRVRGWEFRAV